MSPRKGVKHTDETKRKIPKTNKGKLSSFLGKTHSEETKRKISRSVKALWKDPEYVSKTLENNRGRKYSEDAKKRFSIRLSGSGNPNWRGGQLGYNRIRLSKKQWKIISKKIMASDNHTCQSCGCQRFLQVHHIIPHSLGGPDEEWNLITYCRSCHSIVEHQEGAIKITTEMSA